MAGHDSVVSVLLGSKRNTHPIESAALEEL